MIVPNTAGLQILNNPTPWVTRVERIPNPRATRGTRGLPVSPNRVQASTPNEKHDFTFRLIFGLSPNLALGDSFSERLIQLAK